MRNKKLFRNIAAVLSALLLMCSSLLCGCDGLLELLDSFYDWLDEVPTYSDPALYLDTSRSGVITHETEIDVWHEINKIEIKADKQV